MFGKRQIRKWLLSPLVDPVKINDRLDAITDLRKIPNKMADFKLRLGGFVDLEKMLAKVFIHSVKQNFRHVNFENLHFIKLKEFKLLLAQFKTMMTVLKPLRECRKFFTSKRLL